jgi:DNA repair exonuclease SbcCD ATPase subunit
MIEELTLRGFKSYSATRTETVGFTRGVNKVSGRNASGKTTLLEAVLFGLYGDVPGVNKQDLVPLGGTGLDVTIKLSSPLTGQRAIIHREGNLAKDGGFRTTKSVMTVEGEDHAYSRERDIQSRLRELLGIGRNTFLNVVYAPQKEFIEILNPNRTRMDAILGLTAPAEVREQFREVKRILGERGKISEKGTFQERIRNAEGAISEGESQLEEARTRKVDLEKGLEEMRARLFDSKGRVNDLEIFLEEFERLDNFRAEIEKLEMLREERIKDVEDTQNSLGEAPEERLDELRTGMMGSKSTEDRLQRLIDQELGMERREVAGEVSRLHHQIDEHATFKEKGLTVCPTCGQEIDYNLIEDDLEKWRDEYAKRSRRLKSLDAEIETIQGQVRVARERWIKADRELSNIESLLGRVKEQTRALERIAEQGASLASRLEGESEAILEKAEEGLSMSFASIPSAQAKLEDELKKARSELGELQRDVGNREGQLKDADRQLGEFKGRIESQRRVLEEARVVMACIMEYEAKLRALDRIQALYEEYGKQLRENTLAQLEYQTYQYFRRLTDQQLYGACHIDRERYTLEVYPLGGSGKLPAWRAGGGHQSLFALAERLALLRVMGFPHLLILDEPTDAVDSENIPQLLEYVAKSSREIGQVLLVTHHGQGEEEGVNNLRVNKEGGESRVTQGLTTG